MSGYQAPADLALGAELAALAPAEAAAFLAYDHAVRRTDGVVPPKVRE